MSNMSNILNRIEWGWITESVKMHKKNNLYLSLYSMYKMFDFLNKWKQEQKVEKYLHKSWYLQKISVVQMDVTQVMDCLVI